MTNYIIEDELDFFAELQKSLNDNENENENEELCLLSKEPLIKDETIVLECGHKFNYISIFNEIKQQKCKKLHDNTDIIKLGTAQIKCPYCRNIQGKVLPYVNGIKGVTRIRGVTGPTEYEMNIDICQYVFKSGKKKGGTCGKRCIRKFCITHKQNYKKLKTKSKRKVLDLNHIDYSEKGLYNYLKPELRQIAKYLSMSNYNCLLKKELVVAITDNKVKPK